MIFVSSARQFELCSARVIIGTISLYRLATPAPNAEKTTCVTWLAMMLTMSTVMLAGMCINGLVGTEDASA
jgi:hypothetical protein